MPGYIVKKIAGLELIGLKPYIQWPLADLFSLRSYFSYIISKL